MSKSTRSQTASRGTVYGYIRVSSDRQAESGLSLKAQTDLIRAAARLAAKRHGVRVGRIFRDPAVSATKRPLLGRPGGRALNDTLRDGDHLVIAKLDRAFRSARDCLNTSEAWIARGITIHFLDLGVETATPAGRLMLSILAAIAQWESSRIGERIRDAHQAAIAAGRSPVGHRVLGYRLTRGNRLEPLASERRIGRRMAKLRAEGRTLRHIANEFNRRKNFRPGGRRWTVQAVNRMVVASRAGWPRYARLAHARTRRR